MNSTSVIANVLFVGLQPSAIDFTRPFYADKPGFTAEGVAAAFQQQKALLDGAGLMTDFCLLDPRQDVGGQLDASLQAAAYDVILIGAGIRADPDHVTAFEQIIHHVVRKCPSAVVAFNTRLDDSREAILRALRLQLT